MSYYLESDAFFVYSFICVKCRTGLGRLVLTETFLLPLDPQNQNGDMRLNGHLTSNHVTSNDVTPNHVQPNYVTPNHVTPNYSIPNHVISNHMTYMTPPTNHVTYMTPPSSGLSLPADKVKELYTIIYHLEDENK